MKTCRNTQLSEKNRERWIQEVKILNERINHPNVIKALPLPKDIESSVTRLSPALALPALCMEYCEGGDLRKVCNFA